LQSHRHLSKEVIELSVWFANSILAKMSFDVSRVVLLPPSLP